MRLIDADALMYSRVRIAHDDGTIGGYNAVVMSSVINNSPTVEAIPVDWIQSWWGKQGVPSLSHCLENTDEVIRTMLTDWVNENETN